MTSYCNNPAVELFYSDSICQTSALKVDGLNATVGSEYYYLDFANDVELLARIITVLIHSDYD